MTVSLLWVCVREVYVGMQTDTLGAELDSRGLGSGPPGEREGELFCAPLIPVVVSSGAWV